MRNNNYQINYTEKTITVSKRYLKEASTIGSAAYNELARVRKDLPDFQINLDALDAAVLDQAGQPVAAVREVHGLQVHFQFAVHQPHGDVAYTEIFIGIIARPAAVDGDVAGQRSVVDDPHGQVSAGVAKVVAVQDALGSVPLGASHNGLVVP